MAKVKRKELLKSRDEFLTFTEKAGKWLARNKRRLFIGAGAALVVVALAAGLFSYNRYQQKQAALAYGQAFYMYNVAQVQPSPGALAMLIQTYNRMAEDFGSSKAGLQARQFLGALYMQSGDLAKAEDTLSKLSQESGGEKDLQAITWGTLAQCMEMAGKTDEAIQAYAKAVVLSGPNSANTWKLSQARLLLKQNQPAAAQELYEQIWGTTTNNYLGFIAARMLLDMGKRPSQPTSS